MNTPTNNPHYNRALASWAAAGHPSAPQCENCSSDLTGREVVEYPGFGDGGAGWCCTACARAMGWLELAQDEEDESPDAANELRYAGGGYAVDRHGCYREAFWAGTP